MPNFLCKTCIAGIMVVVHAGLEIKIIFKSPFGDLLVKNGLVERRLKSFAEI